MVHIVLEPTDKWGKRWLPGTTTRSKAPYKISWICNPHPTRLIRKVLNSVLCQQSPEDEGRPLCSHSLLSSRPVTKASDDLEALTHCITTSTSPRKSSLLGGRCGVWPPLLEAVCLPPIMQDSRSWSRARGNLTRGESAITADAEAPEAPGRWAKFWRPKKMLKAQSALSALKHSTVYWRGLSHRSACYWRQQGTIERVSESAVLWGKV